MTTATSSTLNIAQTLALAARTITNALPEDLWVAGTVSGLSRSQAGHVYFQLADNSDGTPSAVLPVVAFAREAGVIGETLAAAGVDLEEGLAIRVRGRLGVYAAHASVQLIIKAVDPAMSVGERTLARRRLVAALVAEGCIGRQKALAANPVPLQVGIVGPRGAGTADVLSMLESSSFGCCAWLVPVSTSGPGAPAAIARGLRAAGGIGVDVVLLTRGGGARSELAAFDTEVVARAICECPAPVITALGHSTDRTVADECAWAVAITPTDAAGVGVIGPLVMAEQRLFEEAAAVARAGRACAGRASGALEGHAAAISSARIQAEQASQARASARRARRNALLLGGLAIILLAILVLVLVGRH
jgi:exodeoxyribonuclease VII large subunit